MNSISIRWSVINKAKFIRAIRLLIAIILASICGVLLKIPMSGWIIITITVVLFDQETVGGTINRSFLRFIATLFGSIISILCIVLFKNNPIAIWLTFIVSSFVYAYYYMGSKRSYIGVLGIATVAIILIGNVNLEHALYRIMDIIIGISFALISMLIFFPEYALDRAHKLLLMSLNDINYLITSILQNQNLVDIRQDLFKIETKFLNDITAFNKTIEEACFEYKARKYPQLINIFIDSVTQIRRLYRLFFIIFHYEVDNHIWQELKLSEVLNQISQIIRLIPQSKNLECLFHILYQQILLISNQDLQRNFFYFHQELTKLNQLISEANTKFIKF